MWSLTLVLLLLAHLMASNNRITDRNVTFWQRDKVSVGRIKHSHLQPSSLYRKYFESRLHYASCVSPDFTVWDTSLDIKF
jgi:hypothetical protein